MTIKWNWCINLKGLTVLSILVHTVDYLSWCVWQLWSAVCWSHWQNTFIIVLFPDDGGGPVYPWRLLLVNLCIVYSNRAPALVSGIFSRTASEAWPLHLMLDTSSDSPNQNRLMHIYVRLLSGGCTLSVKYKSHKEVRRQTHDGTESREGLYKRYKMDST